MLNELEVLGRFEDIGAVVGEKRVDELILALDLNQYDRIITILKECLRTKKVVRLHSNFLQVVTEKLKVEFYNRVPVIMLSQYALDDYAWSAKRLFDVLVSLIALVLLAPVFLFIAVGIKMSSKGPVIFRQERIGKKGKPFEFYKFRSMHMNGDDSKHKKFARTFILNSGELNQQGEQIFKIADDPRVFRFGKFIRKTSLDEFPQLVNVLKGDMTLVGPRPSLAYEWEVYKEWHKKRAEAPPGCTGLWQTAGRSSVTFEEMIILDLYYISNMTLLFDIKIMLQTFPVLLFGKGAY
ncbi:MAG: exopolysaccharide biosynthesis polyprenyl glycosylphosphotransferase [Anaerolineaceae bacterium]